MGQRLGTGEIWRHCAACDHFWKPPGNDLTCCFCGDLGLVSFVGPMLGSAHEHPSRDRVETTWHERWLNGEWPVSQRM